MKTEGFVKLLRKIIREEVSKTIKTELKPLLNEMVGTKDNINLQELSMPKQPAKSFTKKQYTKNPVLNDLLNETSGHVADNPWPQVDFKSEMAPSFGTEQHRGPITPLATTGINGERINMNNEAQAAAINAMTRDYSSLIKAIDKKNGKMGTR